jgi:hypothetical protein
MWNTMEIFDGQGRCLDNSAQRGASNECVHLIRKLRWMGMDDEAEHMLAQLTEWSFQPTETVSPVLGQRIKFATKIPEQLSRRGKTSNKTQL